jgi:hypothetical protein
MSLESLSAAAFSGSLPEGVRQAAFVAFIGGFSPQLYHGRESRRSIYLGVNPSLTTRLLDRITTEGAVDKALHDVPDGTQEFRLPLLRHIEVRDMAAIFF